MSDAKTMNLSSLVSKKTRRAKARLLQNFAKTDKTTDELFEVYQANFQRQHGTALNLQKHMKHYLHCLKELHEASKGLSQCLLEMHEREWPKHDVFENNAYDMDHVNEDLEEKIKESVVVPLEQYIGQFPEMREKISKRGRKLLDYDTERHSYEALQQQQSGKYQVDDARLSKSRDQLEEAKKVYDSLNSELHEELPALYDNRLPFLITIFQRLFSSKITYHQDNLRIQKDYLDTVEQLAKASEKGAFDSISTYRDSLAIPKQQPQATKSQGKQTSVDNTATSENQNGGSKGSERFFACSDDPNGPVSSTTTTKPKPLHKVRATYKYLAEDDDELSFEAGEIIQVIEYDDPQEQEEGWLMGIKESNGQKGLFPANFTKEIK